MTKRRLEINMKNVKKCFALAISVIFILSMICACGDASEQETAETTAKATVTAGEAAEQEAQKKAANDAVEAEKKQGTEDPAIDAVKAAAFEDIEGFDGNWNNISVDVDDTITTIEFDWNKNHYKYQYDQANNQIIKQ